MRAPETDERSGTVTERERAPLDVCFAYADVDAAYRRASGEWGDSCKPTDSQDLGPDGSLMGSS